MTVSAELREKRGPVLKFSFKVAPDEALEIPEFLSHRVSELLLGRIAESGDWRAEPLLASTDAGYAALAAEADRRFNAKEYPPASCSTAKRLSYGPVS